MSLFPRCARARRWLRILSAERRPGPRLRPRHLPFERWACLAVLIAAAAALEVRAQIWSVPVLEPVELGRLLFEREWQEFDTRSVAGDGLGPMFNARSCVACHNQGGIGGSGPLASNVELLCLVPTRKVTRIDRRTFVAEVASVLPSFVVNRATVSPTITFHKSSTHPAYDDYRLVVATMLDPKASARAKNWIRLRRFERRTPSLFGAGLIDSIPPDVLRETARQQAAIGGANGRVPLATDGGVGKFGWRGQTSSLKRFVQGACANELGLHVPTAAQPRDPLARTNVVPGLDMNQQQCDALASFVASIPAPAERIPAGSASQEVHLAGERTFQRIGCAACHPATLGDVAGIYSDLLLHDMGPELADPAGPNVPSLTGAVTVAASTSYYGGSIDVFVAVPPETQQLWRTPPLWGLADSGPYLHDGRARTLDQAILMHRGDARAARNKYAAMGRQNRFKLLVYLYSLGVPPDAPRIAANLD